MKCPHCKDPVLVMSERQGIEIDYCPSCRGIWLDRGELDKIIEKSKAAEAVEPREASVAPPPAYSQAPAYAKEHSSDHYPKPYKYKRKKSLLEELFD